MLRRTSGTLSVLITGLVAAASSGVLIALTASVDTAWRALGVDPLSPRFADLRNVLDALECTRLGHDVLAFNPCDPWRRPLNYPRLWLTLLTPTGLDQRATAPLGIALALVFVAAAVASLRKTPRERAWVAVAALLSPPVTTLVERGNVDAAMFVLTALAVPHLAAARAERRGLAWAALAFASALKLFPAFALAAVGGDLRRRRTRWEATAFAVAFALYLAATRDDLAAIQRAIPRSLRWTYGREVLPGLIDRAVGMVLPALGPLTLGWLGPALAGTTVVGARALAARLTKPPPDPDEAPYLGGAGMYVGTLFVGHNFAYRLVVLLLCVPTLARWSYGDGFTAVLARATLGLLLLTLWCGTHVLTNFLAPPLALVQQSAAWTLAACVLAFSWRIAARPAAT